jgi:hypothetical protein
MLSGRRIVIAVFVVTIIRKLKDSLAFLEPEVIGYLEKREGLRCC